VENSVKAGVQQLDLGKPPLFSDQRRLPAAMLTAAQVLTFTMALSFGINDYIEGGVIAAVITLNIVVG
jgi:hypothetical protein